MNETIGVKGGKNDRRRTIKIKEAQKKKLNEYVEEQKIKELEKEVRKQQVFTLLKTLPIAIAGGSPFMKSHSGLLMRPRNCRAYAERLST